MKIKEKIISEIKDAQKSRDAFKLSALRLVKSAIDYKEMELKKSELEEDEVMKVLQNLVKQRKDSIEQFTKGNRPELAKKEETELKIIETFLPASISKDDIEKIVSETISELGLSSPKDMGKAMKGCMEKLKGQLVDGKMLSEFVKSKLQPPAQGENDVKK